MALRGIALYFFIGLLSMQFLYALLASASAVALDAPADRYASLTFRDKSAQASASPGVGDPPGGAAAAGATTAAVSIRTLSSALHTAARPLPAWWLVVQGLARLNGVVCMAPPS